MKRYKIFYKSNDKTINKNITKDELMNILSKLDSVKEDLFTLEITRLKEREEEER